MKYFEDADIGDDVPFANPLSRDGGGDQAVCRAVGSAGLSPRRSCGPRKVVGALFAPLVMTMCIAIRLTHESGFFEIKPVAGLGMEDVRIAKPVFAGDELGVKVTVVAKRDSKSRPELGVLTQRTDVFNQNNEDVLSYVVPSLIYRRPS